MNPIRLIDMQIGSEILLDFGLLVRKLAFDSYECKGHALSFLGVVEYLKQLGYEVSYV